MRDKNMLVYVFETKEWERRYLTEIMKDTELKFGDFFSGGIIWL